jgi:hypothetical protein
MHSVKRRVFATRIARSHAHVKPAGFVETAIFALLGLAVTLILIAHDLFPVLP